MKPIPSRLAAAVAFAFASSGAGAMAPMAEDGERDARWTASPVSAEFSSDRGSATAEARVADDAAVYWEGTTVNALGRGMGRANPSADDARRGVEIVERSFGERDADGPLAEGRGSAATSRGPQAVGPQGWRGDLGDAMHSDDQQSLTDDVGPQGWERDERAQAPDRAVQDEADPPAARRIPSAPGNPQHTVPEMQNERDAQAQPPQPAQDQEQFAQRERGGLSTWNMTSVYQGFSAEHLLDAGIRDRNGNEIGQVENLVVNADGQIQSVIGKVGEAWDTGPTHVAIPWTQVQLSPGVRHLNVPVSRDNVDEFSVAASEPTAPSAGQKDRQWRVTEWLDEAVRLSDQRRYGTLDDVIFDRTGRMQAVIVNRDPSFGAPYGPYAYPHAQGQGQGYDWVARVYVIPYTEQDLQNLSRFEYDRLEGADRGETAQVRPGSEGNPGVQQNLPSGGQPQTNP